MSLYAGETIEILEKNEHGWWLGIAQRNGHVYRGYFPKNYVKEKVRAAPAPPPRPQDMKRESDVAEVTEGVKTVSVSPTHNSGSAAASTTSPISRATSVRRAAFSLRSLAAFDELTDRGYAVEIAAPAGANAAQMGTQRAAPGDRVELQVVGLIWDGASTDTREFGRGTLRFTLGQRAVPAALEQAVSSHLCVGQSATITAAPAQAYGAAGNPPHVPANSFVIFHTIFVSAQRAEASAPEGPAEFFTSGVASNRDRGAGQGNRRDSRILLVESNNNQNTNSSASAGTR